MMKKWWMLLIISVAAAFLLELIQIRTQPVPYAPAETEEMKQQETALYPDPDEQMGVVGYEITGDGLETVAPDPQLHFQTADCGTISNLSFRFSRATESALRIQVFYLNEEGYYSEQSSVVSNCPAGVEYWAVQIPERQHDILRIDIAGSPIPLVSIKAGNVAPAQNPPAAQMHMRRIAVVAVLLFAVLMWMKWFGTWTGMKNALLGGVKGIREGKWKSVLYALAIPAGIAVSVFLFWIFCKVIGGKEMTSPRIVFAGLVGLFGS